MTGQAKQLPNIQVSFEIPLVCKVMGRNRVRVHQGGKQCTPQRNKHMGLTMGLLRLFITQARQRNLFQHILTSVVGVLDQVCGALVRDGTTMQQHIARGTRTYDNHTLELAEGV